MCDEYWKEMFDESKESVLDEHFEAKKEGRISRLQEAYDKAHEIRKFEIDLYWKRALYFWGFESAIILAFFGVLSRSIEHKWAWLLGLSFVGMLFTMVWRLALKGSKQWQENWEHHIDFLEDSISGKLYRVILFNKGRLRNFYSVSGINLAISKGFVIVWSFVFLIFMIVGLDGIVFERNARWMISFVVVFDIFILFESNLEYLNSKIVIKK